jgi:hypothetical protein
MPPGSDILVSQWHDPNHEMVPIRIVVAPDQKEIHVDILTPELQAMTNASLAQAAERAAAERENATLH